MNGLVKLGIGAVAAFVVYEYFKGAFSLPGLPAPSTGTPVNPLSPAVQNGAAPPPSVNTRSLLLMAAKQDLAAGAVAPGTVLDASGNPLFTQDEWNFEYHKVRGIDAPVAGFAQGENVSIDEWLAKMPSGFSGLGFFSPWKNTATPRNPFFSTPLNALTRGPF